jgi:soluble lytic murein transglycosylase
MRKNPAKANWNWRLGVLLLVVIAVGIFQRYRAVRESSQDAVILAAARKYQVEPALIKAVVWRESRFDPSARGRKGEVGLMQLRQAAAEEWAHSEHWMSIGPDDLLHPDVNTLAGTWYLRKLIARYQQTDNPLPYALADYNAGRTHVLDWAKGETATNSAAFVEKIGFPSTRDYVKAILKRRERYRGRFPSVANPASTP